jgi:hypothetical protein
MQLDVHRSWALLGLLACPDALKGTGATALLSALLREGGLLHVYRQAMLPLLTQRLPAGPGAFRWLTLAAKGG